MKPLPGPVTNPLFPTNTNGFPFDLIPHSTHYGI